MDRTCSESRRASSADFVVMVSLWALVAVLLAGIAIEPLFAATPAAC
jgi:hypothetical protein